MAQVDDPLKTFQFNVLAAGLNPYEVQTCTLPDWELEVVEHGDINSNVKTAGRVIIGTFNMEKLRPIRGGKNWVWNWITSIQNIALGGGLTPLLYKRNFDVVQYAYDGFTVTDKWECQGVWPSKINGQQLSRTTSENAMDNIDFQVDKVIKRK